MKRLIRKAMVDFTQFKNYREESDLYWSNIYSNLYDMPGQFIEELSFALENFSNDRSQYSGEHPLSICDKWLNQFTDQLDAQQVTNINMIFKPEITKIGFDNF